jgi:Family of unknown function (DUF6011)
MHIISSAALFPVIMAEKNNDGANFTIRSKATNVDYTYKISRSKYQNKWYTHIYVETGYLNFVRVGTYFNGRITHKGVQVLTPSAIAINYLLTRVELKRFEVLDTQIEVMHTGNCLRCGRTLTDANSIESGLGPICRSL